MKQQAVGQEVKTLKFDC